MVAALGHDVLDGVRPIERGRERRDKVGEAVEGGGGPVVLMGDREQCGRARVADDPDGAGERRQIEPLRSDADAVAARSREVAQRQTGLGQRSDERCRDTRVLPVPPSSQASVAA